MIRLDIIACSAIDIASLLRLKGIMSHPRHQYYSSLIAFEFRLKFFGAEKYTRLQYKSELSIPRYAIAQSDPLKTYRSDFLFDGSFSED
jgi:hypothetical protein